MAFVSRSAAVGEANRVLRENGNLIVTVPYLDSNDKFHVRIHDENSLRICWLLVALLLWTL